jgi:hypothetical protein
LDPYVSPVFPFIIGFDQMFQRFDPMLFIWIYRLRPKLDETSARLFLKPKQSLN